MTKWGFLSQEFKAISVNHQGNSMGERDFSTNGAMST